MLKRRSARSGKIGLAIICRLMPARLIARLFVRGSTTDVDRLATILFSYRADDPDRRAAPCSRTTTCCPIWNRCGRFSAFARGLYSRLDAVSNSMSFVSTLLLPALTGARVAFAADLLGQPALGAFCRANDVSLIHPRDARVDLDTVEATDLPHLRQAVVGGGVLDEEVRARFLDKFGVEPLQGYGYANARRSFH